MHMRKTYNCTKSQCSNTTPPKCLRTWWAKRKPEAKSRENKKKLDDLESKKQEIIQEGEIKIKEAEERLKSFYQSPYLLPGIWSAMMPSVIPYGGGINPFPMPLPFVSTFPGMIYLAILFIDAIEEKIHDDIQKTKDPNCEDQL